uniref:FERM domain-containing protein n=1 Tax=Steinernema glaseri TaxID=37863 RepID=A0A1I7Y7B8_9BILA
MDVSVAIVQLRQSSFADRHLSSPRDYDVYLVNHPSSSKQYPHGYLTLPRTKSFNAEGASEAALRFVSRLSHRLAKRAVEVPQWSTQCSRMRVNIASCFYIIPLLESESKSVRVIEKADFYNLEELLHVCLNRDDRIETESKHLIIRLEEWLGEQQARSAHFLASLFMRAPAHQRLRICVHNPAYSPVQSLHCFNIVGFSRVSDASKKSSDLEEEVKKGNKARVQMIRLEKYDALIINPIFGSGLRCHGSVFRPEYYANGRITRQKSSITSTYNGELWAQRYPLHKAAYDGDALLVKTLLNQGINPNECDSDSWTPLHYCAFYNRLKAMQMLLNFSASSVNIPNKTGATPLHFAALNANEYMVQLILSHPDVKIDARDKDGKMPIDHCKSVPRPEWQAIARMLANWTTVEKIQMDMMDGGNLMLPLNKGTDTTADDLKTLMCTELEMQADSSVCNLFAVWICSKRLSLQLKGDHKVLAHLKKWDQNVAKWGHEDVSVGEDRPRLVFRRDAKATLVQEEKAPLNERALILLYEEARENFLKGLYFCNDNDTILLAALLTRIIFGFDHKITDKTLPTVLPHHKIVQLKPTIAATIKKLQSCYNKQTTVNTLALQKQFLKICWSLTIYGSTFFETLLFMNKPIKDTLPVHAGINDYGLHLINSANMSLIITLPLKSIEFSHKPENPYINITSRSTGYALTLRTPQVRPFPI